MSIGYVTSEVAHGITAMGAAYAALTGLAAIACAYAAVLSISSHRSVTAVAERLNVPVSWMAPLGALLAAGSAGLMTGFAVPVVGTGAACGLIVYFLFAAAFHIRAHDSRVLNWVNWAAFFALSAATLAVGLAYRGPS